MLHTSVIAPRIPGDTRKNTRCLANANLAYGRLNGGSTASLHLIPGRRTYRPTPPVGVLPEIATKVPGVVVGE